jgi:hypothetical protein
MFKAVRWFLLRIIQLCYIIVDTTEVTFRWDIPVVFYKIININNIGPNTTQLMILLKCISYIVSFNDMFRL